MTTWKKTKFRGIRYREHPVRKHGIHPDRYYTIRFQKDGERIEEALGWASSGWTETKAFKELESLRAAATTGEGESRLSEKREKVRLEKEHKRHQLEQEEKNKITFSSFWNDTYLPNAIQEKNARNCKREISLYKKWIEPVIGNIRLVDIIVSDIQKIKTNMNDNGLSPRSIEYAFAVIRQVFNYAKKLQIFQGDNPISFIKKRKYDNKRVRFLSKEEAKSLLDHLAIRSKQLHDMAQISLECGLRAGEIFKLTWADVDIEQGMLYIKDTKSGKNRHVPITTTVKSMLSQLEITNHNDLIFKDRNGNQIKQVSPSFARTVNDLGFNDNVEDRRNKVTFHTLRHTYASWMVLAGINLYIVKNLLGHSSISMTERYAHLSPDRYIAAVKQFETMMKSE